MAQHDARPISVLREVVDHVKALPQQSDIGSSHEWGSVITSIPITAWASDDRRVLGARTGDSHEIVGAFDRVLADGDPVHRERIQERTEEHTYELQSLMRISYAVFCLKK